MYLAEKEAQPVADGIILENPGFSEDGILSDRNWSRLSERAGAPHGAQTCALWILEKLTTWLLGWEYCVTLGLGDPQPISADFQTVFPDTGSRGLFLGLCSIWTWDLNQRSLISLVIFVCEHGCFMQAGHQMGLARLVTYRSLWKRRGEGDLSYGSIEAIWGKASPKALWLPRHLCGCGFGSLGRDLLQIQEPKVGRAVGGSWRTRSDGLKRFLW